MMTTLTAATWRRRLGEILATAGVYTAGALVGFQLQSLGTNTTPVWPPSGIAFAALYSRHKDFVIRIALRFVHDNDMALDVLQETFSYLLQKFPPAGNGFQLTAKMTSFLYPVAKNSAITLMRKVERFPSAAGTEPDELPATETRESSDIAAMPSNPESSVK